MKKIVAMMGMFLTMAATTFTGTALPASAQAVNAKAAHLESWSVDDDWSDDDEESWNIHDYESQNLSDEDNDLVTVRGTKHFLALRSDPSNSDNNIIAKLYNGDKVLLTNSWSGSFVKVYSPDYDCYGWVNGNYLC